jgi:hypothetical protein
MGKGKGSMPAMNNGGIGGTGIFGMFGTTVRCDSNDSSFYCSLAKLINMLIMFLVLAFFFYLVYMFFFTKYGTRMRGSSGR